HNGIEYFIDSYGRCCALVIAAFVEEFRKDWRNYLLLDPIIVDLPRARARKESHAPRSRPQRQMHRQTITANQAAVVSDIGKMLEQRSPFRQHIDDQALILKPPVQLAVVSPSFHWPDRASVDCYG